ncbi:unnamed protein product [Rotaria socialis]|uniref:Uncharacterized protein n=3 Tax=Rotaria socialis TaxID=392032 RepID=A0A820TCP4_9BILA|nr:unnamed protein product [Rotaria socialis]
MNFDDLFTFRRQLLLFTIDVVSGLTIAGVNAGLVVGLKNSRSAVAVDSAECSRIGRIILEKNGTTMDAALAAAICGGVMDAHSMGVGSGCVITINQRKTTQPIREKAPLAANSTMFVDRDNMSVAGGLAIGVSGELRTYEKAYKLFGGGVTWKELFEPTIQLCREGFRISESQCAVI